jgi:hypothetical protein
MNKSLRVVLACAMFFAISLEGKPRSLAGGIIPEDFFTRINDLMNGKSPNASYLSTEDIEIKNQRSPDVTEDEDYWMKKNIGTVFAHLNRMNLAPEREDLKKELDLMAFFLRFSDEFAWEEYLESLKKINLIEAKKFSEKYNFNPDTKKFKSENPAELFLFVAKGASMYFRILIDNKNSKEDIDYCTKIPDFSEKLRNEIQIIKKEFPRQPFLIPYGTELSKMFVRNFVFYCENRVLIKLKVNDFEVLLKSKFDDFSISMRALFDSQEKKMDNKTHKNNLINLIAWTRIIYTSKDERMKAFKMMISLLNELFTLMSNNTFNSSQLNTQFSTDVLSAFEEIIKSILKDFIPGTESNQFFDKELKYNLSFGGDAFRTMHTYARERLLSPTQREKFKDLFGNIPENFRQLLIDWTESPEDSQIKFWSGIKENNYKNPDCISLIYIFVLGTKETFFEKNFGQDFNFSFKQSLFRNFKCLYDQSPKYYGTLSAMLTLYEHDNKIDKNSFVHYKDTHKIMIDYIWRYCIKEDYDFKIQSFYSHIYKQEQTISAHILYLKAYLIMQSNETVYFGFYRELPEDLKRKLEEKDPILDIKGSGFPLIALAKKIKAVLKVYVDDILKDYDKPHITDEEERERKKIVFEGERFSSFWNRMKNTKADSLLKLSEAVREVINQFKYHKDIFEKFPLKGIMFSSSKLLI